MAQRFACSIVIVFVVRCFGQDYLVTDSAPGWGVAPDPVGSVDNGNLDPVEDGHGSPFRAAQKTSPILERPGPGGSGDKRDSSHVNLRT
jgi:hypothetical protein